MKHDTFFSKTPHITKSIYNLAIFIQNLNIINIKERGNIMLSILNFSGCTNYEIHEI